MRKKHHGFSARELYLMALVAKERAGSLEQSAAHMCSISKMAGQSIIDYRQSSERMMQSRHHLIMQAKDFLERAIDANGGTASWLSLELNTKYSRVKAQTEYLASCPKSRQMGNLAYLNAKAKLSEMYGDKEGARRAAIKKEQWKENTK